MRCRACGVDVAVAGVFPGARVRCGCGAELVVSAVAVDSGPYRAAALVPAIPDFPPVYAPSEASKRSKRPRACPRCSALLDADPIARCIGCGGAFVGHSALDEALTRTSSRFEIGEAPQAVDVDEVRYLRCPDCAAQMSRTLFGKRSGVVVDVCSRHGTWFDPAELERAAQFAVMHGRPHALPAASRPKTPGDVAAAELKVALLSADRDVQVEARSLTLRAQRGSFLDLLIDWIASD